MRYLVTVEQDTLELDVELGPDGVYRVSGADGPNVNVTVQAGQAGLLELLVEGQQIAVQLAAGEARAGLERYQVRAETRLDYAAARRSAGTEAKGQVLASMPGRVVRVLCAVGSSIESGSALVVIEAMKMQNELCAKSAGVVRAVHVSVGQNVERGALLIELE